jgi:hypothetical protein
VKEQHCVLARMPGLGLRWTGACGSSAQVSACECSLRLAASVFPGTW